MIRVLGSLNMDLVLSVERHPLPGETLLGGEVRLVCGGKGANQAAAALAGGSVSMIGRVGRDHYGEQMRSTLEHLGVDVSRVTVVDGSSGMALIAVDARGQNSIIVSPGANSALGPDDLSAADLDGVAVILTQLETPLPALERLLELAWLKGIPVMLNAAPAQRLSEALLRRVSYLVVNEHEAEILSGVAASDQSGALLAAQTLSEQGIQHVIVTLGARGVVWYGRHSNGYRQAFKVEPVDTTAAGDAFCGAMAARLAEGAPLEKAIAFASAAGALAVTRPGATSSLPSRAQIEVLMSDSGMTV